MMTSNSEERDQKDQNSSSVEEPWTLLEAFEAYAKFGDEARNKGRVINHKNSLRWIRAANILQFTDLDDFDVTELLTEVSKDKPTSFRQFEIFIDVLAQIRDLDGSQLRLMLRSCGPPNVQMDMISFTGVKDMWHYENVGNQLNVDPKSYQK